MHMYSGVVHTNFSLPPRQQTKGIEEQEKAKKLPTMPAKHDSGSHIRALRTHEAKRERSTIRGIIVHNDKL